MRRTTLGVIRAPLRVHCVVSCLLLAHAAILYVACLSSKTAINRMVHAAHVHTAVCRVLATGFPKDDHMSNSNTIAHVITFGKTVCKNSANRCISFDVSRLYTPPTVMDS